MTLLWRTKLLKTSLRSLAGLLVVLLATLPARADHILVFAAASMKTTLEAVTADFENRTGHTVAISFAGSSVLARQIQQGAPANVFLAANTDWMDVLDRDGLLAPDTRRDLLSNRLVLIGHEDTPPTLTLPDLPTALGTDRLAMALVDAVPAGLYGKAALQSLGMWDALAPRVAQTDNVRAALALVAVGEAPYGIVYATDAQAEPRVTVLAEFPENSHPPIVYPVAAQIGYDSPATRAFLDHLSSTAANDVFRAQGFGVIAP